VTASSVAAAPASVGGHDPRPATVAAPLPGPGPQRSGRQLRVACPPVLPRRQGSRDGPSRPDRIRQCWARWSPTARRTPWTSGNRSASGADRPKENARQRPGPDPAHDHHGEVAPRSSRCPSCRCPSCRCPPEAH